MYASISAPMGAILMQCRILLNVLYCAKINRDKRNGKYVKYEGYNDDRDPKFMMVL
jgi:hypothetical protein